MEAYKCDRCGKLYERQVKTIFYIEKINLHQDLCPECKKSLEEWWKSGKEQNEVVAKNPLPYKRRKGKCPTCGVVFVDRSTNYCGNCGQKLDWGDSDE